MSSKRKNFLRNGSRFIHVQICWPHWGRVTHICVSDLTSIGSDNGLSPGRRQAIIRTNPGILLIRPLGTNFSGFLVEILIFSFKKMRLKVSSAKRRPFCLGLNVLTRWWLSWEYVNRCYFMAGLIILLLRNNNPQYFLCIHDDVIKWKHFPRYWPFMRGIHRSPANSPHKGQWRGALMFSLICALNKQLSKQSWGVTSSRIFFQKLLSAISDCGVFWGRVVDR